MVSLLILKVKAMEFICSYQNATQLSAQSVVDSSRTPPLNERK